MKIQELKIRKILASNTKFTLEVEGRINEFRERASVPFGTSRGKHEAVYLPINSAMISFEKVKKSLLRENFEDVKDVDKTLRIIDGTENFSKIGANVALAISYVCAKLFAKIEEKEIYEYISEIARTEPSIPRPICNVIGGGKHGGSTEIQEFHILPIHEKSFSESISTIARKYTEIAEELKKTDPFFSHSRNLESAWLTSFTHEKILEVLEKFSNEDYRIGIDFAASHLWDEKFQRYVYPFLGAKLNIQQQVNFVSSLLRDYPITFVEDPFEEDDFISFSTLTSLFPGKIICGDDLYATNVKRLRKGIEFKSSNAVLIKPNQVGTITDTIEFVKLAKRHNIVCVMSHRSGETEEIILSHLAVGLGCDFFKLGIGGERAVKINEILRIEERF